ncbi:MAG: hypothetical protein V2A34_02830 [Lentisphaerota bacterium]
MRRLTRYAFCLSILAASASMLLTSCQIPKEAVKAMPKYVRVEKQDGRYWFVRGGDRFVSLGINVVQPSDSTQPADGRIYNVLPNYSNNVAAWAQDAVARLKTWRFTTVGAWSHEHLYTQAPVYHTRIVNFGEWGNNDSRLIDVFSETYAAALDRAAVKEVAPHATNEYLIGYFANNELPWYGERGWPTSADVSLLSRYMLLPEKGAGKVRLIEFLRDYYTNSIDALKNEWETEAASFDDLAKKRRMAAKVPQAKKVFVQWSGLVAEQYFKLCAEMIKKYDTNHLFLGSRFAERAQEPVMAACGKYADVVSLNHYRRTGIPDILQIGTISALAGKPVMITEFSFRAMENSSGCPNSKGADVTVQTQADRARAFRNYATTVLAQPYIMGYDWFMYHDQPPSGRFDGEDSNYGLLDIHDQPYTELLNAITEINGRAIELHAQSAQAAPAYNPLVLCDYRDITLAGADQPLKSPIVFSDATSGYDLWGDFKAGSSVEVEPTGENTLLIKVNPGSGWGCGITFKPVDSLAPQEDGSVNLLGGSKVLVSIKAPDGSRIGLGFNESGTGPMESQTFAGFGQADGEAYTHPDRTVSNGTDPLAFRLLDMQPGAQYGNQRGNKRIDTDAIKSINLFFPGGQKPFEAEFKTIQIE